MQVSITLGMAVVTLGLYIGFRASESPVNKGAAAVGWVGYLGANAGGWV